MAIQYEIGDGADALFWNQIIDTLNATYWTGGWTPSAGSGAMEVDVASGDGKIDGSDVSTASTQTVTISGNSSGSPRKDTIYVDTTGTVQVAEGTAKAAEPTGEIRENTYIPEPPSGLGFTGVVVAEVWVPDGASDITGSDIRDRRLDNGSVGDASGVSHVTTTEPTYQEGATWLNPDTGVLYVAYDAGGGGDFHPVPPVTILDEATAFDGSDGETVSHTDTATSGGSVELPDYTGNVRSRPSDNSSFGTETRSQGAAINPNINLDGVRFDVSGNVSNTPDRAAIRDSGGTILAQKTGLSLSPGDTVELEASLTAGTQYHVTIGNGGSEYQAGYYDSPSFNYTGTDLDIVAGVDDGSGGTTGSALFNVTDFEGIDKKTSGSVTIAWGMPSDLKGWDLATFQRTLDGETVTVDVVDAGGTVLHSDISENFDISTVSTSKEVQLVANLSRASTANNPTLDYAARRYNR